MDPPESQVTKYNGRHFPERNADEADKQPKGDRLGDLPFGRRGRAVHGVPARIAAGDGMSTIADCIVASLGASHFQTGPRFGPALKRIVRLKPAGDS